MTQQKYVSKTSGKFLALAMLSLVLFAGVAMTNAYADNEENTQQRSSQGENRRTPQDLEAREAFRLENRPLMDEAVKNNDFEAWKNLISQHPNADRILERVQTDEDFQELRTRHENQEGPSEERQELRQEIQKSENKQDCQSPEVQ